MFRGNAVRRIIVRGIVIRGNVVRINIVWGKGVRGTDIVPIMLEFKFGSNPSHVSNHIMRRVRRFETCAGLVSPMLSVRR
jgi:hypothetical protein